MRTSVLLLQVLAVAALAAMPAGRAAADEAEAAAGVATLEQVLAKQANAAMDQVLNSVGRYAKLGQKMKWEDALKHCENETPNGRLCTQKEYCPDGPGKKVAGGGQIGDHWAPVNDYHNEWVQIGSDSKKVCRSFSELDPKKMTPAWGDNSAHALKFKGNALCCKNVMDKMDETFPTWEQASTHCTNKNKRLCRRDEYCPEGGGKSPRGGTLYNGIWGAVFDDENEWAAIGYTFPKRHLCRTHKEIAGVKAIWGTTNRKNTRRGMVMCCEDTFDSIAGKMTWKSAALYCKEKSKRLCKRDEMCPEGAGKAPRGGMRPGEAWAPVGDDENEWVSVGVVNSGRKCKKHTEALDGKPTWGQTTGWRGHIMCCDGEQAGEESSEESVPTTPTEESSEESSEAAGRESGAAEESSEESSEASMPDVKNMDLQKAEEDVKAREAEQTAKKAAAEQAVKRRKAAEEAEKAAAMKKGLASEEEQKRRAEEMMKHADGIKEAAAKRAAKIIEEAKKQAAHHTRSEQQKKNPSTVWVNLPKQARLLGPGETVNPLNRADQSGDQ